MGFLQRLLGRDVEKAQPVGSWSDLWASGTEYLLTGDSVSSPFTQVGTVYVAVDRIAENVAKIEPVVSRGEVVIDDHPAVKLMQRGSSTLLGGQLLYATAVHMMLSGEAFWLLAASKSDVRPGGYGRFPSMVRVIPPGAMVERTDGNGTIVGWDMQTTENVIRLSTEEVVFFRLYNPYNEYRGLAPLTAARLEYDLEWKSGKWNELFYQQGARPPFYVYRPQGTSPIPPQRIADMREQFESEMTGLRRGHRIPVMSQGTEIRPIGITQRDMDFLEGRRFSREQILSVFGVPPAIAGVFEYANYANSAEQKRFFWNHTLKPLARLVSDTIQSGLMERYARGFEFELDVEGAMAQEIPEDYLSKIDAAGKLWAMGVPFTDLNDRFGLGFDVTGKDWLEEGFLPFSVTPAGSFDDEPEPTPDVVDPNPDEEPRSLRRSRTKSPRVNWAMFKGKLNAYELAISRRIIVVLNSAERYATERLKEQLRLTKAAADIFPPDFQRDYVKAVQPLVLRAIAEGGSSLMLEIGGKEEFDVLDPATQAITAKRNFYVAQGAENARARVMKVVTDELTKGSSLDEIMASVAKEFEGLRFYSRVTARTEASAAFNSGRFQAMNQAGVEKHMWLTSGDELVRETHVILDGAVSRVGFNDWEKDGTPVASVLRYPHDPAAPAHEVINCRCVTVAVTE